MLTAFIDRFIVQLSLFYDDRVIMVLSALSSYVARVLIGRSYPHRYPALSYAGYITQGDETYMFQSWLAVGRG